MPTVPYQLKRPCSRCKDFKLPHGTVELVGGQLVARCGAGHHVYNVPRYEYGLAKSKYLEGITPKQDTLL